MRKVAALIVALPLVLAHAAQAGVPGDPTPEYTDRPDTLAVRQVRRLIKKAVRVEYTIDIDRRYSRECDRRSRLRMRCRMRWIDDLGTFYKATVEIWRTGTYGSPTDHYRVDADGDRNDAPRQRYEGDFLTSVRRTYFGAPLTIPESFSDGKVRVVVEGILDPAPTGEFETPPAGTRYVGFPMRLTNQGDSTLDESLRNDSRLITPDGRTIDPEVIVTGPCEHGAVTVPPGATRRGCVAFPVPYGQAVSHFELQLGSATADEIGQWHYPPAAFGP